MSARGFLGAGDLYLAIMLAGGVFPEFVGPFECKQFQIKPNVKTVEQTSKGKFTYGQVTESVALQLPADLSVQLSEVAKETMTIALLGTSTAITQNAGTVSDQVMIAKQGKWVVMGKAQVSGVVVTNSGATITYVEGLDYLVNKEMGWVKVLASGAIA